jgi:hypothetical protein
MVDLELSKSSAERFPLVAVGFALELVAVM